MLAHLLSTSSTYDLSPAASRPPSHPTSHTSSPSLTPSTDFLIATGRLSPLNRAPPSTPPAHSLSAYSMPTIPILTHPASRPDLVIDYRSARRMNPALFDTTTQSIKDKLISAKVSRGGQEYLLREEYTVELASREDAARMETMVNREGMAGRSRASTPTEIEMLPDTVDDDEDDDEKEDEERQRAEDVERLLVALLGEDGVGVLKAKCGAKALGGIKEAAAVFEKARGEGKFEVRVE